MEINKKRGAKPFGINYIFAEKLFYELPIGIEKIIEIPDGSIMHEIGRQTKRKFNFCISWWQADWMDDNTYYVTRLTEMKKGIKLGKRKKKPDIGIEFEEE